MRNLKKGFFRQAMFICLAMCKFSIVYLTMNAYLLSEQNVNQVIAESSGDILD